MRAGRECLVVLGVTFGTRMFPAIEGERCRVELPPKYNTLLNRYPANSLILVHNHHANVSFSGPDLLKFLSFKSIYASVLVCADGTSYYVAKKQDRHVDDKQCCHSDGNVVFPGAPGDPRYDGERILTDYHWNHVCLTARYSREIAFGAISEKEALYNHGHENMVRLARMHGFRYGRIGGPPNHPLMDLRRLGE